jgi:predicted anti-sigma-YlaC factor YlaD
MNCNLCKKNLDAYLEGRLPEDIQKEFLTHLKECEECKAYYLSVTLSGRMAAAEIEAEPDPFIQTRIMAKIGSRYGEHVKERPAYARILQPALITLALAAAIFTGITAGSLFNSAVATNSAPEEFVYLDDASLESISLLINE